MAQKKQKVQNRNAREKEKKQQQQREQKTSMKKNTKTGRHLFFHKKDSQMNAKYSIWF